MENLRCAITAQRIVRQESRPFQGYTSQSTVMAVTPQGSGNSGNPMVIVGRLLDVAQLRSHVKGERNRPHPHRLDKLSGPL